MMSSCHILGFPHQLHDLKLKMKNAIIIIIIVYCLYLGMCDLVCNHECADKICLEVLFVIHKLQNTLLRQN